MDDVLLFGVYLPLRFALLDPELLTDAAIIDFWNLDRDTAVSDMSFIQPVHWCEDLGHNSHYYTMGRVIWTHMYPVNWVLRKRGETQLQSRHTMRFGPCHTLLL